MLDCTICSDMSSFTRRLVIGVCVWATCVIGFYIALVLTDTFSWIPWLMAVLAICGIFVVGAIALLSRRLGKLGGAIAGLFCGLLPSLLILVWLFTARPNFMAAAGAFGIAHMLVYSSGVGGALAG